ncbi:MAG: hypothetical protein AB7E04_09170 [Desulfobacteraceae bacterium]
MRPLKSNVSNHEDKVMLISLSQKIIKQILFLSVIIFVSLVLFGCATTLSSQAMRIHDADINLVMNCKYLGDVHGSSGWGNLAASTGIQNAKNEAKELASAMGATHIVWTNVSGGYSPYVTGKAYSCK